MTNARFDKEVAKAEMRLNNITEKFGGDKEKVSNHINLRTSRMTKTAKVEIWIQVLRNYGFKWESRIAEGRLAVI